jgi:hypothetical protein
LKAFQNSDFSENWELPSVFSVLEVEVEVEERTAWDGGGLFPVVPEQAVKRGKPANMKRTRTTNKNFFIVVS